MALSDITSGLDNVLTGGVSGAAQSAGSTALNAATGLSSPTAQQLQVQLQQEVQAGTITPQQYTAILQNPNAMQNILQNINPAYTQAQNTALSQLQNVASSNGMTPQFQSQLQQANQSVNQNLQGQYGALQQQAQQQGVGGGGALLASKLSALQGAANSGNMAGEQAASNAQNNALQAIYGAAGIGANAQNQAYGEQANVAQAQNAINQFNTQNQNAAQQYNTGAANQAQYANLQNAQNIANTNTGIANQQAAYNAQTPETVYQNQLGQAGAVNNAAKTNTSLATGANNLGVQNASAGSNALSGLGSAVSGLYNYFSDEKLKDNITKFDTDDFLNHITGNKYNYKSSSGLDDGEAHYGPMAQDLEKSEAGKALVEDTPMGKKVNYAKAGGHIFSALGDIHQRVKNLEAASGTRPFDDKQDNMKMGDL